MSNERSISVTVRYNGRPAGILEKDKRIYRFTYDQSYMNNRGSRPISITMPFRPQSYKSDTLFPVFINMLSEGSNKRIQCRMLKIDENDYFKLLLETAKEDTIGPITIKQFNEST